VDRTARSSSAARVEQSGQVAQVVERSPEKAGVGGSTPSLATMFSITCIRPQPYFCSILFQKIWRTRRGLPL
jgi:hypothetical protein